MTYRIPLFMFFVIPLITMLCSCTRYGQVYDDLQHLPRADVQIQAPAARVQTQLEAHLKSRGIIYRIHRIEQFQGNVVDIETAWIRDSSLTHYGLELHQRIKPIVHWKGVWRIEKASAQTTRLYFRDFELMYLGSPKQAPAQIESSDSWVETENYNLRAWYEMRRFLNERFPQDFERLEFTFVPPTRNANTPIGQKNFRPPPFLRVKRPSSF